ncbi:MAG: site-specific DNA-methyltransferase [Geobacter sp.]|nr:site-specific DNA-methyltransferase [Geobacter sp.]
MDSLKMQSPNLVDANVEKIATLFPNCITEDRDENGTVRRVVDFDLLRQELSSSLVEGPRERYTLNWPGKNEAILTANAPIAKTLRPCREESVDFDNTRNIYIEGDNLDALKLLQETYLNKIKMIYIDPPYNTGNDFIYDDDFAEDTKSFFQRSNQTDEEDNRLIANTEANGRFHSDWLSMMYSRLKLARNLIKDDGVIFISIDDNEIVNLRRVCDEIFGEDNFVETLVWKRRATAPNDRVVGKNHEYLLMYSRNMDTLRLHLQPRSEELNSRYSNPDNDPLGPWVASDLSANGKGGRLTESCVFPIENPVTKESYNPPQNKCWLYNREKINQFMSEGRIGFRTNTGTPFLKRYLSEVRQGSTLPTIMDSYGFSQDSAKETRDLFNRDVFDFPKPIKLLKTIITTGSAENDLILDFFSGSSTTAQAVMQLNAEDNGNRKFIMVQLPEVCDEKSEAFKAGYKTIAEIGKERIRRAGKKIKEENPLTAQNLDTGFRVLKVDTSNMKDVYYTPDELKQDNLELFKDHIKPDRSTEDLLFQVFIDWGLDLTLPIAKETIDGKTVFRVDTNALIACFDAGINEELVKKLAAHKPLRAVFRDDAFGSDSVKINVEQIFKSLSPVTEVKSI